MMIAHTPENSWSELHTSAPFRQKRNLPGHTPADRSAGDCEQSCTASLALACHGWFGKGAEMGLRANLWRLAGSAIVFAKS